MSELSHAEVNQTLWHKVTESRAGRVMVGLTVLGGVAGSVVGAEALFSGQDSEAQIQQASVRTLFANDGINPATGQESAYAIAGQGSCSTYTQKDALDVLAGNKQVTQDLIPTEEAFLKQNDGFAHNYALTGEPRIGFMYDALGVARPSTNPDQASSSIEQVFNNPYFVTGKLADSVEVRNTYCDDNGNVMDYRDVTLEKNTYVAGMIIDKQVVDKNGQTTTIFKNGKMVVLPENALVVTIELANGDTAKMVATNKAGVNSDGDYEAEVGCLNVITKTPNHKQPGTTTTTKTRESTTTTLAPKHDSALQPGPNGGVLNPTPVEAPAGPATPDYGQPNPVGDTIPLTVTTTIVPETPTTTTIYVGGGPTPTTQPPVPAG